MNWRTVRNILLLAVVVGLAVLGSISTRADDKTKDENRLQNSGVVARELMTIPDAIPQKLLDKANCVIVIPSALKGAFIVGGAYGRGAMMCRSGDDFRGSWGAPTMMALEGGSFGLQVGGQGTDFVLLVMNSRGANAILNSKVKLGVDATVAAGPLGRDAEADTDATFRAEVLSYSRSRGIFAGLALEGSTLRVDNGANERIYKTKLSGREIALHNEVEMPESARLLADTLTQHSSRRS